jgi:hypothetical protein
MKAAMCRDKSAKKIDVISNSSPLFEGSTVPGTLTFERTGPIAIDFEIGG